MQEENLMSGEMEEKPIYEADEPSNKQEKTRRIARLYSTRDLREEPYDENLKAILENIQTAYTDATENHEQNFSDLERTIDSLKEIRSESRGIFSRLRTQRDKIDDIESLGDNLLSKRKQLTDLKTIINNSYSAQAKTVNAIYEGLKDVRKIIANYERDLEDISPELIDLHEMHSDESSLRNYLTEILKNQEKKEKKELTEKERAQVIASLTLEGEKELKRLGSRCLEIMNDKPLAERVFEYEYLVERHNELSESYASIRDRIEEDISKINGVLNIYKFVSRTQIDFIRGIKIPENFVASLNELVTGMERIDMEFSQQAMNALFTEGVSKRIGGIKFDDVISGMIEEVRKKNKERKDLSDEGGENVGEE